MSCLLDWRAWYKEENILIVFVRSIKVPPGVRNSAYLIHYVTVCLFVSRIEYRGLYRTYPPIHHFSQFALKGTY